MVDVYLLCDISLLDLYRNLCIAVWTMLSLSKSTRHVWHLLIFSHELELLHVASLTTRRILSHVHVLGASQPTVAKCATTPPMLLVSHLAPIILIGRRGTKGQHD
jgi:hypothetical protein